MIPRVIITWQDWRTLLSSTVVQNWFLKKDSRKQASYLQLGDLRCNIRTQIDALKICTWLLKYRKRWNQTFNQRIISSKKIEKWRKQKQPSRGVLKICSKLTGEYSCWGAISIKLQSVLSFSWVFSSKFSWEFSCCIFSEHLFLRTPQKGCFCKHLQRRGSMKIYFKNVCG